MPHWDSTMKVKWKGDRKNAEAQINNISQILVPPNGLRTKQVRRVQIVFVDYYLLNIVLFRDSYPLPRMEECIDSLATTNIFSKVEWNLS